MPSLRTILVGLLVNVSSWPITTSYLVPRQFRFSFPRVNNNNNRNSVALQQSKERDDIVQAYQRLGEKLLKSRGEPVTSLPTPPPPPPITTPDPPSIELDTSTLTIPTPSFEDVSEQAEKASQSVVNVVSETIQRAQDAYRGASQALTDSPRQPGMVPNFLDFLKNNFARAKASGDEIDAWAPVKAKLAILQQNTLDFLDIPTDGSVFTPKGPAIVNFIHSEKFAWYAVAVLFVLAVTQRQSGVEAARDDLNALVNSSERKAKDAAEAAHKAAQGAAQAMKLTEAAVAAKAAIQAEKEVLEGELEKIKNEVKDLKTQLNEKHVKASKSAADQATIEALEEEKTTMQAELAKKSEDIEKLRAQVKEKEIKASKIAAVTATIESLEEEKVVLQGSLQTMEGEIESLRTQLKDAQTTAAKAASDAATIEALQKENAELKSEVGRLSRETDELRIKVDQLAAAFAATPPPAPTPAVEVEVDQFYASPVVAEETKVEAPAPNPPETAEEELEEAVAPAPAPVAEEAVAPKKAAKKKSAAKTAAPKVAAAKTTKKKAEVIEVVGEDWKSLSLTSLKRKSIKDLTDYLESKGVTTSDAEGKPLKKSDLVDAVLSL